MTLAGGLLVLAQEQEKVLNDDTVTPGLLGLGVVVALGIALWLLVRSMNRQLRRVDFDDGTGRPSPAQRRADQAKARQAAKGQAAPGDGSAPPAGKQ
jgi:hypothetical protein